MDALVQQLVQKLNLSDDVARQAVTIVVGFLKDKLPAPLAQQMDTLLEGQELNLNQLSGLVGGDIQGLTGGLGGLLSGKDEA